GIAGQILDGKEHDNGRLRQYEQLPQMRCCSFIGLACEPDENDLPEHDNERGQRHRNRQESSGLPEGGMGIGHLTSSLLLEEYRRLVAVEAPPHDQAYPKYQLTALSLVRPARHSSAALNTGKAIPTALCFSSMRAAASSRLTLVSNSTH